MRLRMLRTMPGSPDGVAVVRYAAGEIYDFAAAKDLAGVFLREGWAISEGESGAATAPARLAKRSVASAGSMLMVADE